MVRPPRRSAAGWPLIPTAMSRTVAAVKKRSADASTVPDLEQWFLERGFVEVRIT